MKTTAIGGLLVIVPIAIVLFVLAQLAYGLYSMSATVVEKLNLDVDDVLLGMAITAVALVGLCFLTGLLVRTRFGELLRGWLNRHVGRRIPMYNALSSLTHRFAGVEGSEFVPVEVDLYGTDSRLIGFLIEPLANNRCVVFTPSAPVATVGNIHIVSRDDVTPLNASVADTLTAVTQWGVDTKLLYPRPTDHQPED